MCAGHNRTASCLLAGQLLLPTVLMHMESVIFVSDFDLIPRHSCCLCMWLRLLNAAVELPEKVARPVLSRVSQSCKVPEEPADVVLIIRLAP